MVGDCIPTQRRALAGALQFSKRRDSILSMRMAPVALVFINFVSSYQWATTDFYAPFTMVLED